MVDVGDVGDVGELDVDYGDGEMVDVGGQERKRC